MAERMSSEPDDPLYLELAADRLAHRLPHQVSETGLMAGYQIPRHVLRKALSRIQQEGWIEKSAGHGWCFLPMIDSPEAYEENYCFRLPIEPTGLVTPGSRRTRRSWSAYAARNISSSRGGRDHDRG